MMKISKTLQILFSIFLGAIACTQVANAALPATTYTYSCEQGQCSLDVVAVEGNHLALLIDQQLFNSNSYDEATLHEMVARLDAGWATLVEISGRVPSEGTMHTTATGQRLSTIAVIPQASLFCGGYACGYIGISGIELGAEYFTDDFYTDLHLYGQLEPVLFYEMGRNFFFYEDNLTGLTNRGTEIGFATGFAVFIQYEVAERIASPLRQKNVDQLVETQSYFQEYLANAQYDWNETFLAENYPVGSGGSTPSHADMVASMFMYLKEELGSELFDNMFQYVKYHIGEEIEQNDKLVATLFKSASDALGRNLSVEFQSWKLPLPANAADYQPGSGELSIIQVVRKSGDWFYSQWDRGEVANLYDVTITATDNDSGQARQYFSAVEGADHYSEYYYLYLHQNELCNAFGSHANHTLTLFNISATEDSSLSSDYPLNTPLVCVPPCEDFSDSLINHVTAGRARAEEVRTCLFGNYFCSTETTYFAVGSDEELGTDGSSVVTLTEDPVGHFVEGSCPAGPTAPQVDSVQVSQGSPVVISGTASDENNDLNYVEVTINDVTQICAGSTSWSCDFGALPEGDYTAYIQATDNTGLQSVVDVTTFTVSLGSTCIEETLSSHEVADRVVVRYGSLYYTTDATPGTYLGTTYGNSGTVVALEEQAPGRWARVDSCQ